MQTPMTPSRTGLSPFSVAALLTVPLSLIVEIGTLAAGHELTWFGTLTQIQSQWVRYSLLATATASGICGLAFRRVRARI
jgi:hypothetical protein